MTNYIIGTISPDPAMTLDKGQLFTSRYISILSREIQKQEKRSWNKVKRYKSYEILTTMRDYHVINETRLWKMNIFNKLIKLKIKN